MIWSNSCYFIEDFNYLFLNLHQYVRWCWHEKAVSSKNAGRGCYKTKELFPRKMLGGAGIEKACLTQYVRGGWQKVEFAENAGQS